MRWTPVILMLFGCSEQGFSSKQIRAVGVAAGDFDDVAEPLLRADVRHDVYEGIIGTAVYDRDWNHEQAGLKVEALFGDEDLLFDYDSVFVASGVRGLGRIEYDGVDPDDQLVTDQAVIDNVQEYVDRGGVMLFTDWSYDLLEAAWPDKVDFLGDDEVFDAAQVGETATVTAEITQPQLSEILGVEQHAVVFNYSNWVVVDSVSDDVTVWVRGDGQRRLEEGGVEDVNDAPFLLSFEVGEREGKVVFAAYHLDAQRDEFTDQVLQTVVGNFVREQADDAR